jgi:glycosyltransferase involved in cell wall biosynthesis
MRIGYLVGTYPAVSHTFIAREVEGLRGEGFEVDTFSLHRPDELLTDHDRRLAAETRYVQPPSTPALAAAHLRALVRHPVRWVRTLALALRMSPGGVRANLWHLFYFGEAILVWSWCREAGVRHLHAHFANAATMVVLLAARFGELTWSFTMHGPTEFDDVTRFRVPEKVRSAAFVACISDYARSQLMKLVEEPHWDKLRIVHCGVDPASFVPVRRTDRGAALRVLCVGRLVADKGQELLLRAIAQLRVGGTDVRLDLVGDGAQRATLEELAAGLGVAGAVAFRGSVGQDRIRELYAEADVFCLPSFAEGVPVVLMEAMATELPVVTTRITGVPELVADGETGLLVAPGRVDALVAALGRLAADPGLRAQLGHAGREKVLADYTLAGQVRDLGALYREYAAA